MDVCGVGAQRLPVRSYAGFCLANASPLSTIIRIAIVRFIFSLADWPHIKLPRNRLDSASQYSSGNRNVVAERSRSVMIQKRTPLLMW